MGMIGANLSGGTRERERLFRSLGPLEDPIIAIFFLWAGAGLHVAALGEVGVIAALYLIARAVGKWLGPRMAAFGSEKGSREAWELRALGFGLFPQAGAAIGLGILARDALPVAGEQILAVVLGTVIVFELTGPLAVSRAVTAAGEATEAPLDQPMTLSEAVRQLEERKGVLMAVTGPTTSVWQLANTLNLARRLQTDVVLMPTGDASEDRRGGPPASNELVNALRSYAESAEQNVSVLPECSGDTVAGILAVAREQQVDLLILAWGPNRSRLARLVVEGAHCPVVELPEANAQRSGDRPGLGEVVRTFAGAGCGAAVGRVLPPSRLNSRPRDYTLGYHPTVVTEVIPIQPGPWENESTVVPAEGPRELAEWLASLEREGASWDESSSRKTPWGAGYAVIVAVRSPGPRPSGDVRAGDSHTGDIGTTDRSASALDVDGDRGTIRYFMISGDDVRLLAFRATGAVARFAERLGLLLGPALNPIAERWRVAWRETFVGLEQVAELLGVESATVERWAHEDEDFPLPMLERSKGPLYVREEIVEWLEGKKPPRP